MNTTHVQTHGPIMSVKIIVPKIGCNLVVIKWKDAVFAITQTKFGKSAMTNGGRMALSRDASIVKKTVPRGDLDLSLGLTFMLRKHSTLVSNTAGLPTDAVRTRKLVKGVKMEILICRNHQQLILSKYVMT